MGFMTNSIASENYDKSPVEACFVAELEKSALRA